MYMEKIRWGTMVPRMGGGAIGCWQATGVKPIFNLSWSGLADNDAGIREYWPDVPYYLVDEGQLPPKEDFKNIDFVITVCPCGGLSNQNNSTNEAKKGVDAMQNDWMYKSAEFVLENIKPTVYFGENAQALFIDRGEPVTKKLYDIAMKHGYSFSLFKTDLTQHRIPQHRTRCFYFMWKSDTAPIMEWINDKWPGTAAEFLATIPEWATLQDVYHFNQPPTQFFKPYTYLLQRLGVTHQECVRMFPHKSCMKVLREKGWIGDCIEWMKENYPDASPSEEEWAMTFVEMFTKHKKKFDSGGGAFDRSPWFTTDRFKAVIKKNVRCFVHPDEDRYLNMREYLTLLGFPFDYNPTFPGTRLNRIENFQKLSKGVVSNVAKDCCLQVMKFLRGELPLSEYKYVKQNNFSRKSTPGEFREEVFNGTAVCKMKDSDE